MRVTEKKWVLRDQHPGVAEELAAAAGISLLQARLILNRGIADQEEVTRFFSASLGEVRDPFLLKGMDRAVERLAAAVRSGERICIWGDYDVDGVTATALLISFFRSAGADCFYHIPRRLEEGYGLSPEGLRQCAGKGATVVVTVDCGISAGKEALVARDLGIDLIITDHHAPGSAIPDAMAVINPHQPGCLFPCKALAGVGVAFYLMVGLRSVLRRTGFFSGRVEPDLREWLDLVALGTIADVVPLVDENRIFVRHGLEKLSASARPGIDALKSVAAVNGTVGCGAVGFRLAPRLNAAGRLEDAAMGVELLLASGKAEAAELAAVLDGSNRERQAVEQNILEDALQRLGERPPAPGAKSIVLASPEWHQGVIGIVASRLVELFYRPVILISLTQEGGKGSGRSIPGFDLHAALQECSRLLEKFGGHRYAAGLSIAAENLERFTASFEAAAEKQLAGADLLPSISIDLELSPNEITLDTVAQIRRLLPFGIGNPEPVFLLKNARVVSRRVLKESHLKLRIAAGGILFDAIGFNMGGAGIVADQLDLVFSLEENEWQGRRSVQLRIRDIRPSLPEAQRVPVPGEAPVPAAAVPAA